MDKLSLKDFIDFAYSLVEMEEVKKGKFPLPKEITYPLYGESHVRLQLQIHHEKADEGVEFTNEEEFYIDIMGITFKFIKE
jgi:hypothetical protein